jgi:hypothetical protein
MRLRLKYEFPTLQAMPEVRPPPRTTEQIVTEIDFINGYNFRIATNLRRVGDLIEFAENRFTKDRQSQIKDDILRAAVVFLHATLEDFLRYIGGGYIPSGSEDVLDKISLVGSSDRPEKFSLGKLAKHRDKKIDQLITESVEAHLDRRSFSSTKEIANFLDSVGVPSSAVDNFYPSLSDLIVRRHQIVHRGDLIASDKEQREREVEPIDASKVKEWNDTVVNFITAVAAYKLTVGV